MTSLSVFLIFLFWSLSGFSQSNSWYRVDKLEDMEISVLFSESSLKLETYYSFHLAKYAGLAFQNPSKKLVIVHKDNSYLSKLRSAKIRDFFVNNLGFPLERIEFNIGLPPFYRTAGGEKIVLFLRDGVRASNKTKTINVVGEKVGMVGRQPNLNVGREVAANAQPRAPALVANAETIENTDYIFLKKTHKKMMRALELSVGAKTYEYGNSEETISAWSIDAEFKKRISTSLNATFDLGYTYSNSIFTQTPEYHLALGLESDFENLKVESKIYGRKNWAWIESDSKFATVNDLGLHQGLEFKLVGRSSYALKMGVWAELSLSNTIAELASANVLSFQTEMTLEWFELDTFVTLYRLSRRYKVSEANVVGLNFGYKF